MKPEWERAECHTHNTVSFPRILAPGVHRDAREEAAKLEDAFVAGRVRRDPTRSHVCRETPSPTSPASWSIMSSSSVSLCSRTATLNTGGPNRLLSERLRRARGGPLLRVPAREHRELRAPAHGRRQAVVLPGRVGERRRSPTRRALARRCCRVRSVEARTAVGGRRRARRPPGRNGCRASTMRPHHCTGLAAAARTTTVCSSP